MGIGFGAVISPGYSVRNNNETSLCRYFRDFASLFIPDHVWSGGCWMAVGRKQIPQSQEE